MSQPEPSSKPRRKKVDVPVHNVYPEQKCETTKTFSANFNSRKKHRTVEFDSSAPQPAEAGIHLSLASDLRDSEGNYQKPNRKQLNKEIDRLRSENLQLIEQLQNCESVSLKKIVKLRDKLNVVNNFNGQIINENQALKNQCEQLAKAYDDLRMQLEEAKQCKSCEDMKNALESSAKDYTLLRTTNKELLEDINMLKTVVFR